jgi:hypothetical protein
MIAKLLRLQVLWQIATTVIPWLALMAALIYWLR